jgi:hypothetical protein
MKFTPLKDLDKEMGEYIKKMDYYRSTTLNEDEQQERLVDILTNGYPKPHPFYDNLHNIDFSKIDFTKIKRFKVN